MGALYPYLAERLLNLQGGNPTGKGSSRRRGGGGGMMVLRRRLEQPERGGDASIPSSREAGGRTWSLRSRFLAFSPIVMLSLLGERGMLLKDSPRSS